MLQNEKIRTAFEYVSMVFLCIIFLIRCIYDISHSLILGLMIFCFKSYVLLIQSLQI